MTWYKLEMILDAKNERNCRQFTIDKIKINDTTDIYIEVDLNTIKFEESLDNTVFIGTNLEEETFKGYFSGTEDATTLTFTELQREYDNKCYVAGTNAKFEVEKVEDVKLINELEKKAHWIKMKSAIKAPFEWLDWR